MDTERFDAWTRRRFGGAAAGGLAALVGGLPPAVAGVKGKAAKRRRRRKRRCLSQPDRVWCGGRCVAGECCPGAACGDGANCLCMRSIGGPSVCVQRGGLIECKTTCADAATCARSERCVHLGEPCEGFTTCLPACEAG